MTASFEALEDRRLFAVSPGGTATIDASTPRLDVEGTRRPDTIVVDLNTTTGNIDVTINGTAAGSFSLAQIPAGIRIDGGKGNDTITVGAGIALPVEIRGDKGNDVITGGSGADLIDGGRGQGQLLGRRGQRHCHRRRGRRLALRRRGRRQPRRGRGARRLLRRRRRRHRHRRRRRRPPLRRAGRRPHPRRRGPRRLLRRRRQRRHRRRPQPRPPERRLPGTDDFNDAPDDGPRGRGRGADDVDDREAGENETDDNVTADQVPAAVTAAFNAKYPGVTVREIEREQEDAGVIYKFDFLSGGQRLRARFTEAGQFIDEEVK
jgi:Ca2+-binding RTX toxin-like protein